MGEAQSWPKPPLNCHEMSDLENADKIYDFAVPQNSNSVICLIANSYDAHSIHCDTMLGNALNTMQWNFQQW